MDTKKNKFITFYVVLILLAVFLFFIQREKNVNQKYRIGVLNYSPAAEPALEGLKKGLERYGYTSRNLEFFYQGVIQDKDMLIIEAERLLDLDVDLIFAMSSPAALAAKRVTLESGLPVIFAPVSSPVEAGLVTSMSRPGGNLSGVTFGPQEPRRLDMLLKIAPHVKHIYVPYNPDEISSYLGVERLKEAALKLGANLVFKEVREIEEVNAIMESLPIDVDAIFLPTDSFIVTMTGQFAEIAQERKIPMTCPQREGVKEGALFSYGFSIEETGYQAARMVDQVFKGVNPLDLPVELSEFTLTINMKTAEEINLDIPRSLVSQANIIRE